MQAKLRYLRVSPRKTRLVVDLVRGKGVSEAINILTFTSRAASEPVRKLIMSAIANAEAADKDQDDLFIKEIFVDEGPTLRRFRPRAMGRATRINKRTSHVTCVLGERE
ncbi:50S ribosomal protein L22 [Myxococcota bacterium]|nr:50S ribosomal protein L22 [Myxococcota bacterium]MBU1430968.1 50S ribosomal protein L22 [Myxococcota bacterium]MBU1897237.1 50S ribosomal protein L22 [Myxococcota bacterium]